MFSYNEFQKVADFLDKELSTNRRKHRIIHKPGDITEAYNMGDLWRFDIDGFGFQLLQGNEIQDLKGEFIANHFKADVDLVDSIMSRCKVFDNSKGKG